MSLYATVWSRPGHATFGQTIAEPPSYTFSFHDGVGLMGDGALTVPESYTRFDDILKIDTATPANCVSSLVRIYDDATLVGEWLPGQLIPTTGKSDFDVKVSGRGIKSILTYARVEAWDWDGSVNFVPTFPDWIYGGRNLVNNPGFEDSPCRPEVNEVTLDPTVTGGTFTLSDGTDTTSAIPWNEAASNIENILEADIAAIDDVLVTGSGQDGDPWVIEFVNPCTFPGGLIFNGASLTPAPGDSELTRTQFGALVPDPWTKSQTVSDGTPVIHGEYTSFRVTSTEAHTGTFSLLIDPAAIGRRFAGAQQIVNVDPGGVYQASVWVKTNSASQQYRFVVRGLDEDILQVQGGGDALQQMTLPSGVWTEFSLPDVLVGDNTRIILRIANINVTGNPAIFYVDDGAFDEGQAATTIGEILRELYEDATVDHAGRVVWEDEANPGTPYLTLDFSDSVDSNGNAWVDPEISIKIWMRFNYFQVMDTFASTWGYEWRIVPDDPDLGTWLWQVYNPAGMQTDYSALSSPAIQGGSSDTRRSLQRFVPDGTNHLVEGLARLTSRATNTGLDSALGRIETSRIDRELPSDTSVSSAAAQDAANTLANGVQYQYTLVKPQSRPLVAYQLGDRLAIHDPPQVEDDARFADVEIAVSPTVTEYEVTFIVEESGSP